ncbi:hypothetical protein VT84_12290 [Gemmata sp. SH-PL17]|uniref:hypothetical protein n=1 Tax=Gemmata sp. SH-PL17 TaxID=1630693 RepID=UPI00078E0181|nr:hypothetical protein [Gemmata sp. SH-PL17]AMV25169.1 hypothetical protein VT84_12290 [Gemmata sp. SH-PL17]
MNRNRVAKLERVVRERPCPGCGRIEPPPNPRAAEIDFHRLSRAELEELGVLVRGMTTPPCSRCGRSAHDFARMTEEQLYRTIALLRKLFGRGPPSGGSGGS